MNLSKYSWLRVSRESGVCTSKGRLNIGGLPAELVLRGRDLNPRPLGYELSEQTSPSGPQRSNLPLIRRICGPTHSFQEAFVSPNVSPNAKSHRFLTISGSLNRSSSKCMTCGSGSHFLDRHTCSSAAMLMTVPSISTVPGAPAISGRCKYLRTTGIASTPCSSSTTRGRIAQSAESSHTTAAMVPSRSALACRVRRPDQRAQATTWSATLSISWRAWHRSLGRARRHRRQPGEHRDLLERAGDRITESENEPIGQRAGRRSVSRTRCARSFLHQKAASKGGAVRAVRLPALVDG